MKSEIKTPQDQDRKWKVKLKYLMIEIERWNFKKISRILEKRDSRKLLPWTSSKLQIKSQHFPHAPPSHAQAHPSHAHMLTALLPATQFPQFLPAADNSHSTAATCALISLHNHLYLQCSPAGGACCDFDISLIAAFLLLPPPAAPGPCRVYNIDRAIPCRAIPCRYLLCDLLNIGLHTGKQRMCFIVALYNCKCNDVCVVYII